MDATWPKKVADSFWLAAARSFEQRRLSPDQFQMLLFPGVVCTAFSIELGMKALIAQRSQPPKTHNLHKLYQLLPETIQAKLVVACGKPDAVFNASLEAVANLFEEWRYVYELENPQVDLAFLTALSDATRQATDEHADNPAYSAGQ